MKDTEHTAAFLSAVMDASPASMFVVDNDVRIIVANRAGVTMAGGRLGRLINRRGGEVLHCIHSSETAEGCGHAPACQQCVIRNSVNSAVAGRQTRRSRTKMTLVGGKKKQNAYFLITSSPFEHEGKPMVLLVLEDISEFMELRELVPICAKCKKIRQDDQYWKSVESFMKTHMDLAFTHGYCPDCARDIIAQSEREDREDRARR